MIPHPALSCCYCRLEEEREKRIQDLNKEIEGLLDSCLAFEHENIKLKKEVDRLQKQLDMTRCFIRGPKEVYACDRCGVLSFKSPYTDRLCWNCHKI